MGTKVRIAGIIKESIVDGPGIRYVVFAQGCKHNCPGCHNPHTHSFTGGYMMDIDTIIDDIKKNPLLDGITISGGEPFEQAGAFAELAKRVKEMSLEVMVYTGYTFEEIISNINANNEWDDFLENADVLVDGPFIQDKKDCTLSFRGSSNQRIIDLRKMVLCSR